MKPDIENKEDIKLLVDTFYDAVRNDELLGFIFNDLMHVNWDNHLPKMYSFWENILFQTGNYQGRPFPPHLDINDKQTLTNEHFRRWINLFNATVDELFEGKNATEIKLRAKTIKETWNSKINYINVYQPNN
jgi:hemoglobin